MNPTLRQTDDPDGAHCDTMHSTLHSTMHSSMHRMPPIPTAAPTANALGAFFGLEFLDDRTLAL